MSLVLLYSGVGALFDGILVHNYRIYGINTTGGHGVPLIYYRCEHTS